jgi:hypothetical protein
VGDRRTLHNDSNNTLTSGDLPPKQSHVGRTRRRRSLLVTRMHTIQHNSVHPFWALGAIASGRLCRHTRADYRMRECGVLAAVMPPSPAPVLPRKIPRRPARPFTQLTALFISHSRTHTTTVCAVYKLYLSLCTCDAAGWMCE